VKTIGLIGGMSWESSAVYYRLINEKVQEILGGYHNARSLMYTVDFARIAKLQEEGQWEKIGEIVITAAQKLEDAGAEFLVICTNTIHKVAEDVENALNIPLLHIADTTGKSIKMQRLNTVGLLGTKFTMEEDFYKARLGKKFGINVIIPSNKEREIIHETIFKELVLGRIEQSSREKFKTIINNLAQKGAEGVILGCTEIPLLIKEEDSLIPIFDTTSLHAEAAAYYSLTDTAQFGNASALAININEKL
jgi:aspartate racemase